MEIQPLRLLGPAIGVLLLLVACGDDGRAGYDAATREAFMTGCAEDDDDPDLIEVCECTYETATLEMTFERFQHVEQRLSQGSPELPTDIADIIARCIRSVSAARG